MITAIGIALCATTVFLLFAGERIAARRVRESTVNEETEP